MQRGKSQAVWQHGCQQELASNVHTAEKVLHLNAQLGLQVGKAQQRCSTAGGHKSQPGRLLLRREAGQRLQAAQPASGSVTAWSGAWLPYSLYPAWPELREGDLGRYTHELMCRPAARTMTQQ